MKTILRKPVLVFALIAIVLAAYFLRFRLVVEETKMVAVTAREAFDGYDAKLQVVIGKRGLAPRWWGTYSSMEEVESGELVTGSGAVLPAKVTQRHPRLINKQYTASYLFKLGDISSVPDGIELRDEVGIYWGKKLLSQEVPVRATVLRPGEKFSPPPVSRDTGFIVEDMGLYPTEQVAGNRAPSRVKFRVRLRATGDIPVKGAGVQCRVYDRRGREVARPNLIWPGDEVNTDRAVAIKEAVLDVGSVPLAAGPLEARGMIFLRELWPKPFTLPLRDSAGKMQFTRQKPSPVRILKSQFMPLPGTGGDGMIVVDAELSKPGLSFDKARWRFGDERHFVNEQGKTWSLPSNQYGYGISEVQGNRARLNFSLPAGSLPAQPGIWRFAGTLIVEDGSPVPFFAAVPMAEN